MHVLVVILTLHASLAAGGGRDDAPAAPAAEEQPLLTKSDRDRCLGAGAAGAAGSVLGIALGGGLALVSGEIMKAAAPALSATNKRFTDVAVPAFAVAGGVAGLAAGTLGAWELADELSGKASVTR